MQSIRLIRENLIFLYILQKSVNLRLINSAQRVKYTYKVVHNIITIVSLSVVEDLPSKTQTNTRKIPIY